MQRAMRRIYFRTITAKSAGSGMGFEMIERCAGSIFESEFKDRRFLI